MGAQPNPTETEVREPNMSIAQQVTQPPQHPQVVYVTALVKAPGQSMATTGTVLGIMAWVVTILSLFLLSPVGAVMAIVGFILSLVAFRTLGEHNAPRGQAIAGVTINAIPVVIIGVVWLVLGFASACGWPGSRPHRLRRRGRGSS